MDALKINAKVIAVPNTDLMGNHQLEMAEEFANKGWLIHGQIGYVVLIFLLILLFVCKICSLLTLD